MIVRGCTGCGARVEIPEALAREAAAGPVFCGLRCTGRHPSGCPLRIADGVPYHEDRCAGCGAILTTTGDAALIAYHERGTGRTWCDETCQRGSGVEFRWMRTLLGTERAAMMRELEKRRRLVADLRR